FKLQSIVYFQGAALLLFVGPHLSQALARPLGWNPFPMLLVGVLFAAVAYEWNASAKETEVGVFQRTP
ncbi:MAG: hypothetical protein KDA72_02880, partial [Planctomycetales bacterium]|nr:hypothetical protein [Planctomycetales bacterium]